MINKLQTYHFAFNHGIKNCICRVPYFKKLSKPVYVQIGVTHSCNLKCKQCWAWKCKGKDIPTERIKKVIIDLRKWLGPFHLTINSAEPLLRKDTPDFIRLASKLGIMTNLITNGTLLNKEMANCLLESELSLLTVSLDGIRGATHDYIRGVKGTYRRVIKNVINSKERLRIKLATIILENNIDEIVPLIEWVEKNNLYGIEFQPIQPIFGKKVNDPLWYKTNEFWPKNYKKVSDTIDSIIEMKKHGYPVLNTIPYLKLVKEYFKNPDKKIVCTAGIKNLVISFDGKVRLCKFYPSLGNLIKRDIWSIWESEKTLKIKNSIKNCQRGCALLTCSFDKGLIEEIYSFLRCKKYL